jgi:hypothetical protein
MYTLRQRNTYNRETPKPLSKSTRTYGKPINLLNSTEFNNNHSAGTHLTKLMENSRKNAKMMVDAAIQVFPIGGFR